MIVKPGLPWRTQDVRDGRVIGYLLTGSVSSPGERSVVQSTELNKDEDVKTLLTSHKEKEFGVFSDG